MINKVHRNASGQKQIIKNDVLRISYRWWCYKISKKYKLKKNGKTISTFEFISRDYSNENYNLKIEWDHWEGLCITASDDHTVKLLKEILTHFFEG